MATGPNEPPTAEPGSDRTVAQIRAIVDNFPNGAIGLIDTDFRVLVWGGQRPVKPGTQREEIEGRLLPEFSPVWDQLEPHYVAAREGEPRILELKVDDRVRIVQLTPIRDEQTGRVTAILSMAQEITEHLRVEESLRVADLRFKGLFENAPIGLAIVSPEGRWLQTNRALCRLLGYTSEELAEATFQELTHPDDLQESLDAVQRLHAGELDSMELEKRYMHKDGHPVWALLAVTIVRDETGAPLYGLTQIQDISARKRAEALEARMREARTLETVGQLAGGVAHNVNNVLAGIRGYAELVLAGLEPDSEVRADVEQILRAAEHASELPKQLLAAARQQILQERPVDLNQVVENAVGFVRPLLREDIRLEVHGPGHQLPTVADPAQVEQVIHNLVLNARDAMPGGGALAIETGTVSIGEDEAAGLATDAQAGDYAVVRVRDSGAGVDPATVPRLFDPFFTTKKGTGTGLGLSTARGIVSQSGGFVSVRNVPGGGAEFSVHLPLSSEGVDPEPAVADGPPPSHAGHPVLVVEDDPIVRELVSETLRRNGYAVIPASDGEHAEAIALAAERIDLLVTDLVMPGFGGDELARRLRAARPGLPVVFLTGHAEDAAIHEEARAGRLTLLEKPFSTQTLLVAVAEALAGEEPAPSAPEPEPATGGLRALRCLLVDDHALVRDSLARLLESRGWTVSTAATFATAVRQIEEEPPGVAIVDLALPDGTGLALLAPLREHDAGIVVYTGRAEPAALREAVDAGAKGFVTKDAPIDELVQAVETVASGGVYLDPSLAPSLITVRGARPRSLTDRERAILEGLASGRTADSIAGELGIAPETVQTYLRRAMKKLGADTRAQAIAIAVRQALIS